MHVESHSTVDCSGIWLCPLGVGSHISVNGQLFMFSVYCWIFLVL